MTHVNQTAPAATHTPEPWDCDGRTTLYATPDESGEITMIEVRANVTEAGWDTVAFLEATWPGADATARRICAAVNACEGIGTESLKRGVVKMLLGKLQAVAELRRKWRSQDEQETIDSIEYMDGLDALNLDVAIAKITDASQQEPRQPIVIEVRGGVVQEVLNVPPGYEYEVRDYDAIEAADGEDPEKPKQTYRVKVLTRILEIYEVEAASPEEAEELYALGDYLGCDEEALDNEVVSVEGTKP